MDHMPQVLQDAEAPTEIKFGVMIKCANHCMSIEFDSKEDTEFDQLHASVRNLYGKISNTYQYHQSVITPPLIRAICWFLRVNANVFLFWKGLYIDINGFVDDRCVWLLPPVTNCIECTLSLGIKSIRNCNVVTAQGIINGIDIVLQCNSSRCQRQRKSVACNKYQIGSIEDNNLNYEYWDNTVKNDETLWCSVYSTTLRRYVSHV